METYIDLINRYLNNLLSESERIDFENKLKSDSEFKSVYDEHLIFINGLQRIQVKGDILKAKRSYTTEKWIKISGVTIIILGVAVLIYTLIFNTSEIKPNPVQDDINTTIVDSTAITTKAEDISVAISEEKTDTIATTSEAEISYTTTTKNSLYGGVTTTHFAIKKQPQILTINTAKDTFIRCKEGTLLKILKGAFIHPVTRTVATGNINLSVTEYYKLSDILMANLSTSSNEKQLETGGMLYVEAYQGDMQLELNPDTPIELSFPHVNPKNDMQLFSGEWIEGRINWTLQNDELESIEVSEEIVEVPFSIVDQVPTFPGCEDDNNEARKRCTQNAIQKFINKNFNTDVGIGLGITDRQRILCVFKIDQEGNVVFVQSNASHPNLSEEADRVINMLPQMIPGMQRGKPVIVPYALPIVFRIDGDPVNTRVDRNTGSLDSVRTEAIVFDGIPRAPVEMDTVYTEQRGMVEMIREVMHDKDFPVDSLFLQEWDRYQQQKLIRIYGVYGTNSQKTAMLRKPLFDMEDTKFKVLEDDSITRGGHVIRKLWDPSRVPSTTRVMTLVPKQKFTAGTSSVTAEEFESRLEDREDTSISSRDVGYYVLKTSSLGWINCDRFINGRTKRIKYKLKIKNAEGASVSMIFKSYNSVLPSWHNHDVYDFRTVSDDEDIVLIAIKRKDGKLYYDSIETKTQVNPNLDFEFKEVSIEELKRVLDGIGGPN